jgi:hypothetical protein
VSVIILTIAQRPRTDSIGKMETVSSLLPSQKATGQQRNARWLFLFCWALLAGSHSLSNSGYPDDSFSIQVIEPYPAATDSSKGELSLDESQILQLACRCTPQSELVLFLARSQEKTGNWSEAEQKRETVVCLLANVAAQKIRSERAAVAMKAHYGLAATELGTELVGRTEAELTKQMEIQKKLIEAGVSVPDDSLLTRLQNETNDSKLEIESKERVLRIQLSGLISSSHACSYVPVVKTEMMPCDIDVCGYVERALECHYELAALGKIRGLLGPDSIELGNELLALVAKVPYLPVKKFGLLSRLKASLNGSDLTSESNKQKNWLNSLMMERRQEIAREIEIAYENKRTAALRWSVTKEQLNVWSRRVEQLEKLGTENRGTIAELGAAKLSKLKEEAQLIERWMEWQTANVDLKLALGECICHE